MFLDAGIKEEIKTLQKCKIFHTDLVLKYYYKWSFLRVQSQIPEQLESEMEDLPQFWIFLCHFIHISTRFLW